MKNLKNIEVFHIEITDEGTFAHISFQDLDNFDNINNGYDNIRVPMNLRVIQKSVRDNVLVNQSVEDCQYVLGNISSKDLDEDIKEIVHNNFDDLL